MLKYRRRDIFVKIANIIRHITISARQPASTLDNHGYLVEEDSLLKNG